MPKTTKKSFKLNRETLTNLTHRQLMTVAGGGEITNNPGVSACVCYTKPGRCNDVGTDFCTLTISP
jgi:hypothetical protein